MALQFAHLSEVIQSLHVIVPRRPGLVLAVRPHYIKDPAAWGELPVSTAALAAESGIPSVAFTPAAPRVAWILNDMGRRATDVDKLGALIDASSDPALRAEWETPDGRALLASGLGPRDGSARSGPHHRRPRRAPRSGARRTPAATTGTSDQFSTPPGCGALRRGDSWAMPKPADAVRDRTKFPILSEADVIPFCGGLRGALDRFHRIRVERTGPHLVRVRASR